jgi:hypothetical protein
LIFIKKIKPYYRLFLSIIYLDMQNRSPLAENTTAQHQTMFLDKQIAAESVRMNKTTSDKIRRLRKLESPWGIFTSCGGDGQNDFANQ